MLTNDTLDKEDLDNNGVAAYALSHARLMDSLKIFININVFH